MTARQFFVAIKNLNEGRAQKVAEFFYDMRNNTLEDRVLRRLISLSLNISRNSEALDREVVEAWVASKQSGS